MPVREARSLLISAGYPARAAAASGVPRPLRQGSRGRALRQGSRGRALRQGSRGRSRSPPTTSAFLLKDVTAERLFEGVRVIAAGQALLQSAVTRLISEFAPMRPRQEPSSTDPLATLTPRETQVPRLVAGRLTAPSPPRSHLFSRFSPSLGRAGPGTVGPPG